MPNEEYRKHLEEWEAQQQELARKKGSDENYRPSEMKVRAPLGCILMGTVLILALAYLLTAHASVWKRWLF